MRVVPSGKRMMTRVPFTARTMAVCVAAGDVEGARVFQVIVTLACAVTMLSCTRAFG
jgi:hypothetical protein